MASKKIHYTLKQKLVEQSLREIEFDTRYRRNKRNEQWKLNEQFMKAYDIADGETKSKIPLFQAISFEETLLSKIDNSLTFKMGPGGLEDKKKSIKFNALRERDAKVDRWDSKDRAGKRNGIRYGRVIYLYTASGPNGYKPNLESIRPRNFHIDPDVKGGDIERALHMGWWGVRKTKAELKAGIKSGLYDKKDTEELIAAGSNYFDHGIDDVDERNASNTPSDVSESKKLPNKNVWLFYQHFTHDEDDVRYILLLTPAGKCIRCERWDEVDKSGLYPIWTWSPSPDENEFWNIAPMDRVRRIFKGMEKSINQMMDNADQVNKPKLAVNVDFIRNLAQAKYGVGGFLEITGNTDVNKAMQVVQTPPIDTPLRVFDKLQMIVDRESGVTAQAAGVSDEKGVLGIYDGNQENLGDRLGLLNKEYSEGYYRFATLWKNGVRNFLTSKVAIRILGPQGIGIEEITWNDIKPGEYDYDIIVESTAAETQMSDQKMKSQMEVLGAGKGDPYFNQRLVREKQLQIVEFSEDDIRGLLDVKDGSEGMLVQAYEDFEKLVTGREEITVPRNANLVYIQAMTDLWEEKDELITKMFGKNKAKAKAVHEKIEAYINEANTVVERNEALKIAEEQAKAGNLAGPEEGGEAQTDAQGNPIDASQINMGQVDQPQELQVQEPMQ